MSKSSKNREQAAKDLILAVYKDSRSYYISNQTEFLNFWRTARGEPLKKGKKFNRVIPIVPAYIDLLVPRLAGRLPIFSVEGRHPGAEEGAATMEAMVKYYLDVINFHDTELKSVKQSVTYGTLIVQQGWDLEKRSLHPDAPEVESVVKDQPLITIIPIENVFPHRKKVWMQDSWPIIIRTEESRRDLKADPNLDSAAIDKVGVIRQDAEFFSQTNRKNTQDNISQVNPTDDKDNDVLIKLEFWGSFDLDGSGKEVECVITLINGEVIARMERNPFWHQRKPFAKLDFDPQAQSFFSDGLVKQLQDLQLELNEIRNVRSAARATALKPPLLVDRSANVDVETLKWENAGVWQVDFTTNQSPIRQMNIDSKLLELEREELAVKADMQIRAGVNDVVIGSNAVGIAGGDTATGANLAAEQTGLRFTTQAILIDQFIKEIGEQMIYNIQQFVDRKTVFQVTGADGQKQWGEYDPENMQKLQFDFKVTPMSTFVEPKTAKRQNLIELKQLYAQDPAVDQEKLDRMIFDSFNINPETVMKSQDQQMKDALAQEVNQLSSQIMDPRFKQLPPEEQQSMLAHLQQLNQQMTGAGQQLDQMAAVPGGNSALPGQETGNATPAPVTVQ